MDFAKNLLKKYGWKEGEGLGKNGDGLSAPLKASFKFDNAGLGLDKSAEFNNHWWQRVFNEAAKNLDIQKEGESVSINVKSDSVEISTKEYSVKKLKRKSPAAYGTFIKTSTLTGLCESRESDMVEPNIVETPIKCLTDEELFAACGGRTAHKGARHGLQLKGKLARIEEQEKLLLAKMNKTMQQNEREVHSKKPECDAPARSTNKEKHDLSSGISENTEQEWQVVRGKNKKKRKHGNGEEIADSNTTEYVIQSKKKKKKEKELDLNPPASFDVTNMKTSEAPGVMQSDNNGMEKTEHFEDEQLSNEIPKKKKKKKREVQENNIDGKSYFLKSGIEHTPNISKKKIRKQLKICTQDLDKAISLTCTA